MNKIKKLSGLILMTAVILLFGSISSVEAQKRHSTIRFIEDFDLVVPAAETCGDEDVRVFGPIDVMIQTTTDGKGGTHTVTHYTPHLDAIGLSSGMSYNAPEPTHEVINTNGAQSVYQLVNLIRLISPGSSANSSITQVMHVTVNANGEPTVSFDKVRVTCHG